MGHSTLGASGIHFESTVASVLGSITADVQQSYYAVQILYPLIVTAIKVSILFLYLRLSPLKSFRILVIGHMLLCTAGGVAASITNMLQCMPIAKAWNVALPGECFDQYILFEGVVIFNLVTNIIIIVLPMPTIWHLHMPLRQRILVLSVFSIGVMQVKHPHSLHATRNDSEVDRAPR